MDDERGRLFHATCLRGRIWLAIVWLALRVLDAIVYVQTDDTMYSLTTLGNKPRVLLFLSSNFIWTTTLIIAVAYRQALAKYALVVFVGLGFAFDVIVISQIPADISGSPRILFFDIFARAAVIFFVLRSWDIKRLTSRIFE